MLKPFRSAVWQLTALTSASALLLAACQPAATPTPAATVAATQEAPTEAPTTEAATEAPTAEAATAEPAATEAGGEMDMDALIKAAQAEGELTTMALPHDWCNYGEVLETYASKYNMKINELNPDAGSGEELEAIKANKDNAGPQAPDVVDVGFAFGAQAKEEGLIQPYKVSTWDTIPETLKDEEGYWYGDYYGVLALEVNKTVVTEVPQDWADLLKEDYKGQVALAGDPRASNQAILAVYAAALANGGSLDDAMPGLEFFKELNEKGNLVPVIAKAGTIVNGETPIVVRWDYLALTDKTANEGGEAEIEIVIPPSAVLGGVYVQGISAYAPHPNAAKLWMEFLYSDEGQLLWLKGGCHPIRYQDLVERDMVPAELAATLPPPEPYAKAVFPTLEQLTKAKETITTNWDTVVGADVK